MREGSSDSTRAEFTGFAGANGCQLPRNARRATELRKNTKKSFARLVKDEE